jgi:pimeloyl-ACP methyl ester carboxylesterase
MATRLQPTDKTLTVNGLRIHYLEWGAANAPPVVCVHGYTGSADAFNALARHFQHRLRIIAPDVRGHGESDWSPEGAYGYRDQMSDVAALADRLELERFALIGTSMGGVIAMAYAAAHPRRLKSLVINDVGPDVEQGSQRITSMVGARPASFATLDAAKEYRAANSPILAARPAEDQHELALGVLREAPDGRWVWKMDPAYIEQRIARGAPARPDLWPGLKALPCPTQVIWGTTSDVLGEQQARRMVNTLPHGELVSVPGIGHAPTLVEPPVLAALERLL